jgi:hypothetical protein
MDSTIEARRQKARHMQGFGAKNSGSISGSCLGTGFYQEPDTTDRIDFLNTRDASLNPLPLQDEKGSHE